MDAHAHLLRLGWAGPGHALDSRPNLDPTSSLLSYKQKGHRGLAYDPAKVGNTGSGLVKPLSISQRKTRFGLGKKAHEPASGNQWWLKGFESALGNIGKSDSEREGSGTSTPNATNGLFNAGYMGKHAGLYGFFVQGQQMEGTITEKGTSSLPSRKRKSDTLGDSPSSSSSTSSADLSEPENKSKANKKHKPAKHTRNKSTATEAEFSTISTFLFERDKDIKRKKHKKSKSTAADDFAAIGNFMQVKHDSEYKMWGKTDDQNDLTTESTDGRIVDGEAERPRASKKENSKPKKDGDRNGSTEKEAETKEERRERRRRRKEREDKEKRKASNKSIVWDDEDGKAAAAVSAAAAARAESKHERRLRKAEKEERKLMKEKKKSREA